MANNTATKAPAKRRDANMDYLKILSIIMIAFFHYFWNGDYNWAAFTAPQQVFIAAFNMFGELGVDCFAMVSGYYMCMSKKPFRKEKLWNLWKQIFFYSVLSMVLIHIFVHPYKATLETAGKLFFPVISKVWWYATAYVLMYIFSPYINKMIHALTKQEHEKLINAALLVYMLIPTIAAVQNGNTESFLYYNRFIYMVVLYVIAAYIRMYGLNVPFAKQNITSSWKPWLVIHILSWAVLFVYIIIVRIVCGADMMDTAIYFRCPNSVIMMALAISLFMMFKECSLNGGKLIPFLSSCTLGIYMIHGGRSGQLWWNRIFHNPAYEGTWMVFADALCALVVIFCAGVAVEFVRQNIDKLWNNWKANRKQKKKAELELQQASFNQ